MPVCGRHRRAGRLAGGEHEHETREADHRTPGSCNCSLWTRRAQPRAPSAIPAEQVATANTASTKIHHLVLRFEGTAAAVLGAGTVCITEGACGGAEKRGLPGG
ncbi:MAG: hypothetical protein K8H88_11990, partial [Sandaracinaceae bacterium]|nr:hypothetical protein [Sandaracinaceae bacterium]